MSSERGGAPIKWAPQGQRGGIPVAQQLLSDEGLALPFGSANGVGERPARDMAPKLHAGLHLLLERMHQHNAHDWEIDT